jgi:hypothetical protein
VVEDTLPQLGSGPLPAHLPDLQHSKAPKKGCISKTSPRRWPLDSSMEHVTRCRGLGRDLDPLCDPMLLELAEVIGSMRTASTTTVLCTHRLKTRTGQRFVGALQSLGHNILPAAELRSLSTWALAPRAFSSAEEILLVTDWHELISCLDIMQEASRLGIVDVSLCGAVVLCERRQEPEARSAVTSACLPCRWQILPLAVF